MNEPQDITKKDTISAVSAEFSSDDSPILNAGEIENNPNSPTIKSRIEDIFRSPMFTNILLAGLFSNSIYLFYTDYETSHRFSSLLMMIQVCCITLFFLIRTAPAKTSMRPIDWAMAVIGTVLPMIIAPVPAENEIVFLMLTQFFGIFITIVAIISLNNSFAIVPALRKIKTGGLYSLIRHPMYFGYFLTFTCVVLQNFSLYNIVVLLALYAANIYRIKAEEELLSSDPVYELYKARVRYRLVPFIW